METLSTYLPWIATVLASLAIIISEGARKEISRQTLYFKGVDEHNYELERRIESLESIIKAIHERRIDDSESLDQLTQWIHDKESDKQLKLGSS